MFDYKRKKFSGSIGIFRIKAIFLLYDLITFARTKVI